MSLQLLSARTRINHSSSSGGDPYWNQVVSLLNFQGPDGSTSILDDTGRIWTTFGNAKIMSNALVLDGTGDYLTTPNSSDLTAANELMTIEAVINLAAIKALGAVLVKRGTGGTAGNDWGLYADSGKIRFLAWNAATVAIDITGPTTLSINQDYHIEVVHSDGVWYIFINGVLDISRAQTSAALATTSILYLGRDITSTGRDFQGKIKVTRITQNVARHTSNFIPPTLPFPNHL